jgi:hypothetical protein
MPKTPRFRDALEALRRHRVDFIVVGGVAAVLNGAPISTFDLDIVHRRDRENLAADARREEPQVLRLRSNN